MEQLEVDDLDERPFRPMVARLWNTQGHILKFQIVSLRKLT